MRSMLVVLNFLLHEDPTMVPPSARAIRAPITTRATLYPYRALQTSHERSASSPTEMTSVLLSNMANNLTSGWKSKLATAHAVHVTTGLDREAHGCKVNSVPQH